MLTQVADGVWTHQSALIANNAVIVRGESGVLLVDPGLTGDEFADLVTDLRTLGESVVAGFATHPDWDHVLWHADLGDVPRYGTALCAAEMQNLLAKPDWREQLAGFVPAEIANEIPLELFGQISALTDLTIPWDGPAVRVIEHQGHARGHAALLIEGSSVLVAGDMLSDLLVPMPDFDADDWAGDYLAGLQLLEHAQARIVIPGHGSVTHDVQARIDLDRAYIVALRDGRRISDPRIDSPQPGWEWVADIAGFQAKRA